MQETQNFILQKLYDIEKTMKGNPFDNPHDSVFYYSPNTLPSPTPSSAPVSHVTPTTPFDRPTLSSTPFAHAPPTVPQTTPLSTQVTHTTPLSLPHSTQPAQPLPHLSLHPQLSLRPQLSPVSPPPLPVNHCHSMLVNIKALFHPLRLTIRSSFLPRTSWISIQVCVRRAVRVCSHFGWLKRLSLAEMCCYSAQQKEEEGDLHYQ